MYTTQIMLSGVEAVKNFVTLTNQYDFPINLATEKYTIDAKSIMGVFSLDLSKPLTLQIESKNSDRVDEFIQKIQQFVPDRQKK